MKGFEISINDAAPILAASDDIVTIIISIGYSNGNYMHVGGMDSSHYYLKWFGKQPKISDKMKVRICEIDTVSPYYERFPSDREEMRKEYEPQAIEAIKSRLTLEAVRKAEKIEATDEEINAKLEEMAKNYGKKVEEINDNENLKDYIKEGIESEKAIDFIVKNAKIK